MNSHNHFLHHRCCGDMIFYIFSIFLFILQLADHKVNSLQIPMCCPFNYKLTISNIGPLQPSVYHCVKNSSQGQYYDGNKIFRDIIILEETSFNKQRSSQFTGNIPKCNQHKFQKIGKIFELFENSCIAKDGNSLYSVECPSLKRVPLNVISKCCPYNEVYDFNQKKCVSSEISLPIVSESLQDFYGRKYFQNSAIFKSNLMQCKDDHVIVEYFSNYHDFSFKNGFLHLNTESSIQIFQEDRYCFEKVINRFARENDTGSIIAVNDSDSDKDKVLFMVRTCNKQSICNRIPCIRKCCRHQEKYVRVNDTKMCVPDPDGIDVAFHNFEPNSAGEDFQADVIEPKAFGILQLLKCPMFKLSPEDSDEDRFYLNHRDGSLYLPHDQKAATYKNSEYCVENTHTGDGIETFTFVCFQHLQNYNLRFVLFPIGLSISCIFFFITLFVYLFIPKLRNLPGKVLICLVVNYLCAYITLTVGQVTSFSSCIPYAYFVYFSFIAAFSWMTIMCFDMWLTFGSTKSNGFQNSFEFRRFLMYSGFGWGLPLILTGIVIIINSFQLVEEKYLPNFDNVGRCWFEYTNAKPHLLYFLGPIGILLIINLILFILTLRYCNRVKSEIKRMQRQNSNQQKIVSRKKFKLDKERFMMNTKLFLAMGISWIIEIISTALYGRFESSVWIPSDIYNTLQGLIVFLIFVFKWRVWYAFLDRLGIKRKTKYNFGATTTVSPALTTVSGNSNILRMKSMESLSSLINPKVVVGSPKNAANNL